MIGHPFAGSASANAHGRTSVERSTGSSQLRDRTAAGAIVIPPDAIAAHRQATPVPPSQCAVGPMTITIGATSLAASASDAMVASVPRTTRSVASVAFSMHATGVSAWRPHCCNRSHTAPSRAWPISTTMVSAPATSDSCVFELSTSVEVAAVTTAKNRQCHSPPHVTRADTAAPRRDDRPPPIQIHRDRQWFSPPGVRDDNHGRSVAGVRPP